MMMMMMMMMMVVVVVVVVVIIIVNLACIVTYSIPSETTYLLLGWDPEALLTYAKLYLNTFRLYSVNMAQWRPFELAPSIAWVVWPSTVDGSEIPRPTTVWMVLKPRK